MKRLLGIVLLITIIIVACVGCASKNVCDNCGKTFTGNGYYDAYDHNTTWCADCATDYYAPFPINNWAK